MRAFVLIPLAIALLVGLLSLFLPSYVDRKLNRVGNTLPLPPPSSAAIALHSKLWIADLHADSLLWGSRDLLTRNNFSHVDVPRLLEGRIAFQAFTIVTKVPAFAKLENNTEPSVLGDIVTLKAALEQWGLASITSSFARAMVQAHRFAEFAKKSNGELVPIRSRSDFAQFLRNREASAAAGSKTLPVAGFLGIEGLHALDGNITHLDVLFDAGVRMVAPTHFFDNELGGSAHGVHRGGLTEFGKKVLRRAEQLGMFIDVAHASSAVIRDVVAMATRPVICSHTGVRGVCDTERNLDGHSVQAIASTGGIIGVAFFKPALCIDITRGIHDELSAIVATAKYVADLVGVDHVGLGSDWDGTVTTPFDAAGIVHLTDALIRGGFSESDIEKIMGGNVQRVLREWLPQ